MTRIGKTIKIHESVPKPERAMPIRQPGPAPTTVPTEPMPIPEKV